MDDAVILYSGILADFYLAKISPDYSSGPYTGAFSNLYITNDISRFTNEG